MAFPIEIDADLAHRNELHDTWCDTNAIAHWAGKHVQMHFWEADGSGVFDGDQG